MSDPVARLIDAGSWLAGTRDYYFGLIVFDPERAPIAAALVQRYGRSRDSLSLRSGSRAGAMANVRGIGLARWTDLAAILQDCEHARVLTDIERALARNALTWLAGVGIVTGDGALDLASVARDLCEVCVITRVPPVDG